MTSTGWLPASILALGAAGVAVAYGTPIAQVGIFAVYVSIGIALPGMLWVRFLRNATHHVAEDLALGLALGYCLEIAVYLAARAVGAPLLVLLWPALTLAGFAIVPSLRRHWRGSGERAPTWWSWSLAAVFGYLLVYSAGAFFAQHHLSGTDTPHVDMPYHLALIGELRHHLPPVVPYVDGVPLAYHWFFYAEAAATSWVTGIDPVTLLYRLSVAPMFVVFVVLTAFSARRLTGGWWTGPVAIAVALFGAVAAPYGWIGESVFDTQTLLATWTSPTNVLGLALFAAAILVFIDLLRAGSEPSIRRWVLAAILVFGVAGAKASLLPLLVAGFATTVLVVAIGRRQLHSGATKGLALSVVALAIAGIVLFRGSSGSVTVGLGALQSFPVAISVGARHASGLAQVAIPAVTLMVALVLWSFLWAGVLGLVARGRDRLVDPPIAMLVGICVAALGAVTILLYPGLNQLYYMRGAAGAFGLITAAGIAALVPEGRRRGPLFAALSVVVLVGAGASTLIAWLGPNAAPSVDDDRLSTVLSAILIPAAGLVGLAIVGSMLVRSAKRRDADLGSVVPLLVVALVMSFSASHVAAVVATPFTADRAAGIAVPADGIAAAKWLRDHSDPADLVATNLHCRPLPATPDVCDARHFWVSAYSERRMLVEGWAYTTPVIEYGVQHNTSDRTAPFWDQPLLAANDAAFTDPSETTVAGLRDQHGVRWLFASLASADADGLARVAQERLRIGGYAVYELGQP